MGAPRMREWAHPKRVQMKSFSSRYSSWLVSGGVLLLCLGILRSVTTPTLAAPKDDVVVLGEVIQTLPVPQVIQAPLEMGGSLLPDTLSSISATQKNETGQPDKQPVNEKLTSEPGAASNDNQMGFSAPLKVKIVDPLTDLMNLPTRILIPTIGLDAAVIPAKLLRVKVNGYLFDQWSAPDQYAAGWHPTSASLGQIGNTVLNGHHNDHGEVFRKLIDLQVGETIMVFSGQSLYSYSITNIMTLQEVGVPLEQRMLNSRWIAPSTDERLTLVTCWPYESNTHRLVIVAKPTP
jgi:LPXTG-site transpeptidase (sortase) family protein